MIVLMCLPILVFILINTWIKLKDKDKGLYNKPALRKMAIWAIVVCVAGIAIVIFGIAIPTIWTAING